MASNCKQDMTINFRKSRKIQKLHLHNNFKHSVVFDIVMDIRCKASCKINIFDRKIEFFIFSPMKYWR